MTDRQPTATDRPQRNRSGLMNALLGAGVMIFAGWIPFVPVVGGALSGYLEAEEPDSDRSAHSRGLRVGAIAGAIASIPAVVFALFVASFFFAGVFSLGFAGGDVAGPRVGFGVFLFVLLAFGFVFSVAYHIALGALGGWLGAEYAVNHQEDAAGKDVEAGQPGRQSTIDDAGTEFGVGSGSTADAERDSSGGGNDGGEQPEFSGGDDDESDR